MNTNNELISVIVPVYNVEPYLRKCLDSILAQTYTNLQILIVDDGSADGSPAICDAYAEKDARITVVHQKNEGLSGARNTGLDLADGAYFFFVDSDDWIIPTAIEELYAALIEHNADCSVGGYALDWDDSVKYLYSPIAEVLNRHDAMQSLVKAPLTPGKAKINSGAWCKLYKRALFENRRFVPGRIFEDIEIQTSLIDRCERVVTVPGYHYHWYQGRKSNLSNLPKLKRFVHQWRSYKDRYDRFYEKEEYRDFRDWLVFSCFHGIRRYAVVFFRYSSAQLKESLPDAAEMSDFLHRYRRLISQMPNVKSRLILYIARPILAILKQFNR